MSAAYYPEFDLAWAPSEAEQRRARRIMAAVLGLCLGFGIVVPLLPLPPRSASAPASAPERIVNFLLEQPRPKPVPPVAPPPKPVLMPEPPPDVPAPAPTAVANVPPQARVEATVPTAGEPVQADPRRKAATSGLLALSDQLAVLRDRDVETTVQSPALDSRSGEKARVDRSLLTAGVAGNSGGIAVAKASSGFGGASTGLKAHATARVGSGSGAGAAGSGVAPAPVERSGQGSSGSRTREEVELVFDRNKSAIYALYNRALRDNPGLQGKVVLEVSIAPSGEVTDCRIVTSELGDEELERKLVARVKMFRFEAKDVAPMTTTKPIEFFPA